MAWCADRDIVCHAVVAVDPCLADVAAGVAGAAGGDIVVAGAVDDHVAAAAAAAVPDSFPREAQNSSALSGSAQCSDCAISGGIRYLNHRRLRQYLR